MDEKPMNGTQYRRELVKSFRMTDDEQTRCWGLLGEIQIAVNSHDEQKRDTYQHALKRHLEWLRSEAGVLWQAEQRKREEDES